MPERSDESIDDFFSTARVTGLEGIVELPKDSYRAYLYDHDDPVLAEGRGMDFEEFTADRYKAPFLRELLAGWAELYHEPFVGITVDGSPREGLYTLPQDPEPTDAALVAAAEAVLTRLTPQQREQFCYPIEAPEWRAWSNPEFVIHRVGLRLETLESNLVETIHGLLRTSLSSEGYERVREAMALNAYLGELTDLPAIMNDRSYWVSLFGTPSSDQPWGWQLFGHHVALNFVVVGGRHVVAPVFIGAEPAVTEGDRPPLFEKRERIAIELAESLTDEQRDRAVVYDSVLDPSMPSGRLHPADERHVAGAFRDNRIVPYEGIPASELDEAQQRLLLDIIDDNLALLVEPQRRQTLEAVESHLHETWFSWYGATDGSQPFYFRVHSPVFLAELDHHAGVWLNNRLPARFHVHTTMRLPNGNDYGRAYLSEFVASGNSLE